MPSKPSGSQQQKVMLLSGVEVPIEIDLDKWTGRTEEGERYWDVRCRVPFTFECKGQFSRRVDEVGEGEQSEEDSTFEVHQGDADTFILEGVASSTSVDWFGTEMSKAALDGMAEQMTDGIVYVPTHWDSEWHDAIGETVEGKVKRVSEVENAAETAEAQYILLVAVRVDRTAELGAVLETRLARTNKIGQSIGGWFTDLRVISNDDGEVIRIIVMSVELDHLAVTRSPANPDSWIIGLRAKIAQAITNAIGDGHEMALSCPWDKAITVLTDHPETAEALAAVPGRSSEPTSDTVSDEDLAALAAHREATAAGHPPMQARHIVDVVDEGETVLVRFQKALDGESAHNDEESGSVDWSKEDPELQRLAEQYPELEPEAVRMIAAALSRSVVPFQDFPIDDESEWSFTTEEQAEILGENEDNWARYKRAHVWFDPDADAETKAAYKLPIANMVSGKLTAFFRGVSSAMAALNGARGGVDIPEDERQAVYNHLVRYYDKAGRDPPDLKSKAETDLDGASSDAHNQAEDRDTGADADSTNPGDDMTPEALALLMATLTTLGQSVEALNERLASDPNPDGDGEGGGGNRSTEPDPVPADTAETTELRAKLADFEQRNMVLAATLERIAQEPQRRGVHGSTRAQLPLGSGKQGFLSRLVSRAKDQGYEAMAAVFNNDLQKDVVDNYADEKDGGRSSIVANLFAVLSAAEADGVLLSPEERQSARWQ